MALPRSWASLGSFAGPSTIRATIRMTMSSPIPRPNIAFLYNAKSTTRPVELHGSAVARARVRSRAHAGRARAQHLEHLLDLGQARLEPAHLVAHRIHGHEDLLAAARLL